MIIMCESADDEHAPFPHRLVQVTESRKPGSKPVADTQAVFVICCNCDHWIGRIKGNCTCEYNCHAESDDEVARRNGGVYHGTNKIARPVRGKDHDSSNRSDSRTPARAA